MQVDYRSELQFALVGGDLGQIPNPRHVRRLPRAEVPAQQVRGFARRFIRLDGAVPAAFASTTKPCSRISAATVLGDTCQPISRKSAVIRGEP
jgi:hypothetical protein